MVYNAILGGGVNPSEKYEIVNGKDDIPYLMENEKRLKPPTRCFCLLEQW
jgi:hypothetical protein